MLLWREKTWKAYKTAVESFKTFRSLYQLRDVWPVPLNDVMYYIAYLSFHKQKSKQTGETVSIFLVNLLKSAGGYLIFEAFCILIPPKVFQLQKRFGIVF
jgi:hypothetical protein